MIPADGSDQACDVSWVVAVREGAEARSRAALFLGLPGGDSPFEACSEAQA